MSARQVWLVRHGETEWSREGRHTGRTDVPLTAAGERAARALGPRLAEHAFAAVWTSPLARAERTCELAGLGSRAVVVPELAEWDYGGYEGRSTPEIHEERPGWLLWRDGVPPGESPGEDAAAVAARVDKVIGELRDLDGDAVLFAHGHLLRVLAARWLDLPAGEGARLVLSTAALSVLGYEHDVAALLCWNDTGHLDDPRFGAP